MHSHHKFSFKNVFFRRCLAYENLNAAFCKILSILCQLGPFLMAFNNGSLFKHILIQGFPNYHLIFYLPYSVKQYEMGKSDFFRKLVLHTQPREAFRLQRCQNRRLGYSYIQGQNVSGESLW